MKLTQINAKIVADSISPKGNRLTSLLITFPRFILAEINTHRMLGKNTSSSRAIPFSKMVESINNDPFIPIAWQKDHKGMQGTEYITDKIEIEGCKHSWLYARDQAINSAKVLHGDLAIFGDTPDPYKPLEMGVTKQLCNRLLEPFMWTTMLITGSKEGWDNFFNLRCPSYETEIGVFKSKRDALISYAEGGVMANLPTTDLEWLEINKGQAEIHMMDLAEKIYDAMNESTPKQLETGQWHIPFEDRLDSTKVEKEFNTMYPIQPASLNWYLEKLEIFKVKISTAMAARTSYTVVGDEKEVDYQKMIDLHDRLIEMRHDSPLEHCARAMDEEEYYTFRKGQLSINSKGVLYDDSDKDTLGWCRNFKGFIPYRHLIENETI